MLTKTRYLYLDIDGVLNNPETYKVYHEAMNTFDDGNVFNIAKVIKHLEPHGITVFGYNDKWGEIMSMKLVELLHKFCYKHGIKVFVISSASDVLNEKPSSEYFQKYFPFDIVGYYSGGGIDQRYTYMVDNVKALPNGNNASYVLLDDMYDFKHITPDKKHYLHVSKGINENTLEQLLNCFIAQEI